ncbi:MAG: flagellar export chaperone FliS [Firmicutes bacterium]|nr:flagellar export chaperone FliS [Bacillota bacterium]
MTAIPVEAYQAYRTTQVQTSSPAELILLLYDGAIKYCRQAEAHLDNGERELAHNALLRSQDIIDELAVSLDFSAGEEIAQGLLQLYDYMGQRLVEANIHKDKAPITEVAAMLQELREAWAEAARLVQRRVR